MKLNYILSCIILCSGSLLGVEWMPGAASNIQFEPALPDDFILASESENPDLDRGVFWGKEAALKQYFQDPKTLEEPIIFVQNSEAVIQKGPFTFHTLPSFQADLKRIGRSKTKITKGQWGEFPIISAYCISRSGTYYIMGWMGLNHSSGKTVMFTLLCPSSKNKPAEDEYKMWQKFIQETSARLNG